MNKVKYRLDKKDNSVYIGECFAGPKEFKCVREAMEFWNDVLGGSCQWKLVPVYPDAALLYKRGSSSFQVCSSHGEFEVSTATGEVGCANIDMETWGYDNPLPVRFNVDEWRNRYPYGKLGGQEHDILDFEYEATDGEAYGPEEEWRKDRTIMRLKGLVADMLASLEGKLSPVQREVLIAVAKEVRQW